jgi:hypothetical protein
MDFRDDSSTWASVSEARAWARATIVSVGYRDSPGRAALPPDVRKAFGFPARLPTFLGSSASSSAKCSPRRCFEVRCFGKAEPYRTSGGSAAR